MRYPARQVLSGFSRYRLYTNLNYMLLLARTNPDVLWSVTINIRSIIAALILLFGSVVSALFTTANAALIEITYPDQDIVRAALSEIDAVDDRVYTLRFDKNGVAEIVFGDGIQGSRPSSGGNVVASYRFGAGIGGDIINEYEITGTQFPSIPIEDFWPTGTSLSAVSFVIVGLTSIKFDFSPNGLQVTDAEPALAPIPVPPTIWLFGTTLIALVGFGKRRKLTSQSASQ